MSDQYFGTARDVIKELDEEREKLITYIKHFTY